MISFQYQREHQITAQEAQNDPSCVRGPGGRKALSPPEVEARLKKMNVDYSTERILVKHI